MHRERHSISKRRSEKPQLCNHCKKGNLAIHTAAALILFVSTVSPVISKTLLLLYLLCT